MSETDSRPFPLTPENLETAYRLGVFPMSDPETGEIDWFQPEPRTLIDLEDFHVPRRLAKTLRGDRFQYTINREFETVIRHCARCECPEEVWISEEIVEAYCALHQHGKAHSVEVWEDGELAGGLYGVALGAAFMGESMFHLRRDASKAALVYLVGRLRERGFLLLDAQYPNEYLEQFGLIQMFHADYRRLLKKALALQNVRFVD
jgi:leucyl/phenylalanyl-tRNA--protein transferase